MICQVFIYVVKRRVLASCHRSPGTKECYSMTAIILPSKERVKPGCCGQTTYNESRVATCKLINGPPGQVLRSPRHCPRLFSSALSQHTSELLSMQQDAALPPVMKAHCLADNQPSFSPCKGVFVIETRFSGGQKSASSRLRLLPIRREPLQDQYHALSLLS